MKNNRILCILHRSPPTHGAAKVGDFISSSEKINTALDTQYLTIRSSKDIADIGGFNLRKVYYFLILFFQVAKALLFFRPSIIYFTASTSGVAFYRDVLLSLTWKLYNKFFDIDVYYHYHTRGVSKFCSSTFKRLLGEFFVNHVSIILLSPTLKSDVKVLSKYKDIKYLPNAVPDYFVGEVDKVYFKNKYDAESQRLNILYLAHMSEAKGFKEVLLLARECAAEGLDVKFNFAGEWDSDESEKYFYEFVAEHSLEELVFYHGFVSGEDKSLLFKTCHGLIYPTREDAYPLTLLESLSFGVPVISNNIGAISEIIDNRSGVVLERHDALWDGLMLFKGKFFDNKSGVYCRERYMQHFTYDKFEDNFIKIFENYKR